MRPLISCGAALQSRPAKRGRAALDAGASQYVLYTQLSNPQSNAIYRRLGYDPIVEQLRYRFG